jgi:hypothetical protein
VAALVVEALARVLAAAAEALAAHIQELFIQLPTLGPPKA